jgi:hypothetical protein
VNFQPDDDFPIACRTLDELRTRGLHVHDGPMDVKPPLAEARACMLNRLAIVTPAVLRRSLGLSTLAKRPALHHPQPHGDWHGIFLSDPL